MLHAIRRASLRLLLLHCAAVLACASPAAGGPVYRSDFEAAGRFEDTLVVTSDDPRTPRRRVRLRARAR